MSKTKQVKKLRRHLAKVNTELEFDRPEFITVGEMLAKMRGMTPDKFYARCIQAEIGAYLLDQDLGEWGMQLRDELDDYVDNP